MNNEKLIKIAASVVNPKKLKDGLIGDVGCALLSESEKIYTGVCIGVNSNVICAERTAIAKMITDEKAYMIKKIVAVWKDEKGNVYVIPPCGNCRQFMKETDKRNINITEVILDTNKVVKLEELLPYHDWWQKIG